MTRGTDVCCSESIIEIAGILELCPSILMKFFLQIRYFTTFLVLLTVQLLYLSISIFSHLLEVLPQCFPDTEFTQEIREVKEPVAHAALGLVGCLVGALTIER